MAEGVMSETKQVLAKGGDARDEEAIPDVPQAVDLLPTFHLGSSDTLAKFVF
jgi:hypothetical protein